MNKDIDEFIKMNKGVINHIVCGQEILTYLEELKVTRRALKMACHQITYLDCDSDCDLFEDYKHPCTTLACGEEDTWVEFYLKKARHQ